MKANRLARTLLAPLALSLSLLACGGEEGTSPNGNEDPQPQDTQNSVDASIGGSASAPIQGTSETPVPQQFTATVALGELQVFLAGADGTIVFFTVDMTAAPLPAKVAAGTGLEDPLFLTVTSPSGVFESTGGGTVSIDACPGAKGNILTGSFNDVQLSSPMGGQSTLSGSFQVVVALHDGSHECTGDGPDDEEQGPPGCKVQACDGPCCPYVQCMSQCQMTCMQTKCMQGDIMGCAQCNQGCYDQCGVSAECRGCLQTLDTCTNNNQCEMGPPADSPCVGQHCCAEYKACF